MSKLLYFNGVDFEGKYGREPMDKALFYQQLSLESRRDPLQSRELVPWADKHKLDEAGWGAIVHEREDPRVLEALAPLLTHRREAAGSRYKLVKVNDEDLTVCADGAAAIFLEKFEIAPGSDVDPKKLPYYLLIIGDPRLISFEFQYELAISFAVGRLCFEAPQPYATYAQNLVATENRPPTRRRDVKIFAAENDEMTRRGTHSLATPLSDELKTLQPGWSIDRITGAAATRSRLAGLMGGTETPSLLMTLGHGTMLTDADPETRLSFQGGLLSSDWEGIGHPVTLENGFFAQDVGPDLDMRGCMAFFFACFTAGTPQLSYVHDPRKQDREYHAYPFVARLPLALLGHERGPLAIIGHVDQAFPYSFFWDDRIHDITHFQSTFFRLMQGEAVGAAMEPFHRRCAEVSAQVIGDQMRHGPSEEGLLRVWIAWHDSRNYIVLGDPAVRLKTEGPAR